MSNPNPSSRSRRESTRRHEEPTRRHEIARRRALALAGAAVLVGLVALIAAPDRQGVNGASAQTDPGSAIGSIPTAPAEQPAQRVTVTLVPHARGFAVPRSFFGYSMEYWGVPHYVQHLRLFERAVRLTRLPGDGTEILRIGGDSTDQSYWHVPLPPGKPRAYEITRQWLVDARRLVRALRFHLILGLNAVSHQPLMAASWARAAVRRLPRHSVVAFEVGNEPDVYRFRYKDHLEAEVRWAHAASQLSGVYSAPGYASTFAEYARSLRGIARRIPIVGPAVADPRFGREWLTGLVAADRRSLGLLTAHRYALSACVHDPGNPSFPTLARLLSDRTSAGMAASVAPAVRLAHSRGLKLRLTEFNSVTCGGRNGVSNTFATALWAPDALFELLHDGVDGVNLHLRPEAYNAPFGVAGNRFDARPAFYGLVMFVRALGRDARLVPLRVRGARFAGVKVWGVRVGRRTLRVLVIDKRDRAARLTLGLRGARGRATVQRLLAPSVSSKRGVTLAGQSLNRHGHWVGRRVVQRLRPAHHAYELNVRGYSAALITVHLR